MNNNTENDNTSKVVTKLLNKLAIAEYNQTALEVQCEDLKAENDKLKNELNKFNEKKNN